ncbi:MAG TPA: hypothetical protein VF622_08250, partial [Segetibacter sp.]
MKRIFISAMLCSLLFACKNDQAGGANEESDSEKPELEKKITKRDYSITAANAYNDIFLDSLAMEKFIVDEKLNDTLIRRMRSFYNARNYQYAWFASDGLTEQTRAFWNLHSYHTTVNKDTTLNDKALHKSMDRLELEEELKVSASDKSILKTEFLLTEHFIRYML